MNNNNQKIEWMTIDGFKLKDHPDFVYILEKEIGKKLTEKQLNKIRIRRCNDYISVNIKELEEELENE